MSAPTQNQTFHLILADIAMAMAVQTLKAGETAIGNVYIPGSIRDSWLEKDQDRLMRQRVIALANAGLSSLSTLDAPALLEKAQRFGVPIDSALSEEIAQHFVDKRNAVLTYNH